MFAVMGAAAQNNESTQESSSAEDKEPWLIFLTLKDWFSPDLHPI